jgi:hypothetical protein
MGAGTHVVIGETSTFAADALLLTVAPAAVAGETTV